MAGIPSAEAARYLAAKYGGTAYSVTSPFKCLFLSAVRSANNGTDTEWGTSGGYTAGTGAAITFNTGGVTQDTAGAVIASSSSAQITNAPAQTWAGCKIVDSTGTPKELSYGAVTGGSKTINAGDTVAVPSGSYTDRVG